MSAVRLHLCGILRAILRRSPVPILLIPPLLLLLQLTAYAQSANLDQGSNDKATTPLNPVSWVNGNLNANMAHFLEGYSVPYRAVLEGLVVNQTYTLVIGFDVRNSSKHALDYLTHFQRLSPHNVFSHGQETVNPLLNAPQPASYFTTTDVFTMPAPSSTGSPVAGQPATSFNALPAGEKQMTGYNADITNITYASQGSLSAANSETVVNITFTALKSTAILAWGAHIASIVDWGKDPVTGEPNSASAINGSPYHVRLKKWIINGADVNIGNQDRSLKTDAVFIPPSCSVAGPANACVQTAKLTYTATVDDANGLTYAWSIIGANTANAKIVNSTLGTIDVVPIGASFTFGSFNLRLIVTREGMKDTCYLTSHDNPGTTINIYNVDVNAGSDQTITNLDTAHLSASIAGGDGTYTFTWTPVTGLSNPNVGNPDFIPPSTGVFQFIVKGDDGNCQDLDTVVITVNEHAKPPCGITGPGPVCPGSQNEYTGPAPASVGSYLWSVTGDGTVSGVNNTQKVLINAANKCGTYQLRLIVSTPDGKRKDTCYLGVQVKDTIKPVLSGQISNANVACTNNIPAAPVIGVTDNCTAGLNVQTSTIVSDSTCVNKYKLTRKWWATDLCGNTSDTLKQVITVNDDVKPVITASFDKTVNVQCLKDVPAAPNPTATDNCNGNVTPVYSVTGSGSACDSTITRKWVFADACGNSDSVSQVIHIKDDIKPALSGSAGNVNVTCSKDIPAAANISATDNCDVTPGVHFSQETIDSTCINNFKVIRKWWAKDACGNTSDTLTQLITVHDDVKPVIVADFDKTVNVQCLKDIPAAPKPTATDNCNGDVQPIYTETGSGSACDSTITRKWVFADACGNSDSVSQIINIKDDIKPILSGSADDVNVTCSKDIPAAANISATDNCDVTPGVHFSQETIDSTCINNFKVIRKWWAKDACGNTSDTLTQLITVHDDVKPVITADFDKTVNVQCLKDIPAAPKPTATDNCNGDVQPVYSETGSGSACDSTITRKWVFADACGNSDSVSQIINIKDDIKPILSGSADDVNVTCSKDIPAAANISATDNCDVTPGGHFSQETIDSTCINNFKVIRKWWAKDACGNTSDTLTQLITVHDDVKPVIVADFDKTVNVQCLKDIPAAPKPTATDNCNGDVQPVYSETGSGSACDSTITRKWVFADACGNSDSVSQIINIKDDIKPILSGSADDVNVTCSKDILAAANISATDNCDVTPGVHFSQETIDSTCINNFKVIRKWWAKDACGNTSDTSTQLITVHDDVKPVIVADFDKTVNVQCLKDIPAAPKPTATDNCNSDVQPIYTETSSGSACDSTITRKWVFADACGNSDSVTQVINIKDNIKPILSGSADDVNVTCSKDIPAAANISATDNCDVTPGVHFSQETIDSTCINNFKVIRKWWAKDACGNTSDTLTQLITVHDDVKPVITADFDKTVNVQCLKDIPAAPKPTATDNCNGDVQPIYTETSSGSACDSTITRKWVFADACGNSDSVTQVINIKDNIKPILSGTADDVNVTCSKDIPTAANISATDNCDVTPAVHFSQTTIDSTCVNNFKVIRKWWVKDACGNTSDTLTQLITVHDDVKPVITADFDKTVNVQCLKDVPAAPNPTATDNCNGDVQPIYSEIGSGSACDSTITRKWVFVDACGNSDSVSQVINIKDDIKPILSGSADDVNVTCSKDIPATANISATDNCDVTPGVHFSQETIDSTCINNFKVIRKWWAKDACGNTSDTLTQTITVHDDVKPVIVADFDKTVNVQCLKDIPVAPKPTATDNCNGNVTPVYSVTGSGSACDSTITRKWVFADACGNTDSVSQVINIKDDIKPILSGSADDVNVTCSKDIPAAANISATDNCDVTPAVHFSQETIDSTCINNFKVIRKWWAKDACGNTSDTLTQLITVHDDVKPVITADFDKTVNVQCLKDIPAAPKPTATDNCNGDVQPIYTETSSGSACDSTITRKWVFADACGNSDSVTQVINIKDNIKPILSGSADDVNVTCSKDIPAAANISATDNCDVTPAVHFSQETIDSTCINNFKVIRKWWAKDACGNTSDTLTQLITVHDDVKPVIVADFDKTVNVQCLKDIPAAPKPTATDNCNGDVQPIYTETGSGSACDSTITRKWVFADACGNSDSVSQIINIKDDIKPILSGSADDVNVTCSKDIPAAANISATDNCDVTPGVHFSQETIDSTCINNFKVIRKWWAKDACGNTSDTLTQLITVHDDVKPVITADFDKTVNVQCLKDIPAAPKPTATDNCNGDVQPIYTETSSGSACDSTITRKWVFADACGNSDSVTQVINIKDNIKPILSGSADDVNVTCYKDIPATANISATDNCTVNPVVYFSQKVLDSTCVNKLKVIRKWWAKDACGNTSDTLKQLITINDDVKPVITAGFDKAVNIQCLKDIPAAPKPTATDNCNGDIQPVYSETGSGSACDSTITRKWVFTDACGNKDSVTQIINIKDNIKPILSGSTNNITVACYKDIPAAAGLTATDNCTIKPVVYFNQKVYDSTCVNKFKVIRKWWAKDVCGNTSDTLTQLITVYDNVKPVITANFNKIVYVQCQKDIPAAPSATATDNCSGNIQPVFTQKGIGCSCDSLVTRKWVFTDACGNKDSVMQLILIKDITAPVITYKPADVTVPCASPVVFGTPVFSDNCGAVTVTYLDRKEGTTCPFRYIRKWTAKDKCNNSVSVEQAVTVSCCQATFCSYTQGYYGNTNGSACTPSGTSTTAKQIMSAAVDVQAGDSVIFGLKATSKYFTLFLGDITNDNIFKMLPGGGTPSALKGYATFNKTNTWGNVPLLTTSNNVGKINNVLLSQTMSLFFNMYVTTTLKNLTIDGDTLLTAKLTACGSNTPGTTVNKYILPPAVVNYLKSAGKANVSGLYELANMYLGGQTVAGLAIGDVSKAVDAINNAFDKCATLVGWTRSSAISTVKVSTTTLSMNDPKAMEPVIEEVKLNVTVFPNPYRDKLIFRFIAPISGKVKLEVYNLLGQQIGQLNYGMVDKGTQHTIEYNVPVIHRDVLLYRLSVGDLFKTGKAIHAKE